MIRIEHTVSTVGRAGQVAQNRRGLLVERSINNGIIRNNSIMIEGGEYSNINEEQWEGSRSDLSNSSVTTYKVKNEVGYGPYGIYTEKRNDKTSIKIPINNKGNIPSIGNVEIVDGSNTINYELTGYIGRHYDNIRIEFTNDVRTFDFVISEWQGELIKPYDMSGEFSVTCIGYKNEIQDFSEPSEPTIVNISPTI